MLTQLGAVLAPEKGVYDLPHRIVWCGQVFCTIAQVTSDPGDKITKKVAMAAIMQKLVEDDTAEVTVRQVHQVMGTMMASIDSISSVRIHTMEMAWLKTWLMGHPQWDWDRKVPMATVPDKIRRAVVQECESWRRGYNPDQPHHHPLNGKLHFNEAPMAVVYTDACEWQKGTYVEADLVQKHPAILSARPFVGKDIHEHITMQETIAAVEGVMHTITERDYHDGVVSSKIDATVAVKYLKCMGGRKRKFTAMVSRLETVCKKRRLRVVASHVPGKKNPADAPSRDERKPQGMPERKLRPDVFNWMHHKWGPITHDLWASEWNAQTEKYVTLDRADTKAVGVDAIAFPLRPQMGVVYNFPPPHRKLLMPLVKRLVHARMEAVVVVPC